MTYPALTAVYAALLALFYIGLSAWVIGGRFSFQALHGDAGEKRMMKRIRSHANFMEYTPLALLLIALLEAQGAGRGLVHALLILLLVSRVLHPIGMFAPPNSPRQFACRGGGIIVTLLVMTVASVMLLVGAG